MEFIFWFASNLVYEAYSADDIIESIPGFGMWMQQHVDLEVSW